MVETKTTVKALQVTGDIIEVDDSDVEDTMTPITADQAEEVLGDPSLSLLVARECPRCAGHDIYQVVTHMDTLTALRGEFPDAKLYSHPAVELPTPVPANEKIVGMLVLQTFDMGKDRVIGPITQEHFDRLEAEVKALRGNPAYEAAVEQAMSGMLPMLLMASLLGDSPRPQNRSRNPLEDLGNPFGGPARPQRRGGLPWFLGL